MTTNPDRKFVFMDALTLIRPSTVKGKRWSDPVSTTFFLFDDILACSSELSKKVEKEYAVPLRYTWIDENHHITSKFSSHSKNSFLSSGGWFKDSYNCHSLHREDLDYKITNIRRTPLYQPYQESHCKSSSK
jgi:hypothetical protein